MHAAQIYSTIVRLVSKYVVQSLFCWPEEKIIAEKDSTSTTVLQVNSFIRGYHEYKKNCIPKIGDEYELKREPLSTVDAECIARCEVCNSHPMEQAKEPIISHELSRSSKASQAPRTTSNLTGKSRTPLRQPNHSWIKQSSPKEIQNLALLDWRNTPTEDLNSSPVQRLFV